MASVDFHGKCKGPGAAKGLFRHCAEDTRVKGKHTNQDIDITRTYLNTSLYGLSYKGMCDKYDARIKELDSSTNTNKRKDRVTLMGLSIPVPAGMPANREDDFFRSVSELLIERYGENNLIDVSIHRDEQHKYYVGKQFVLSRTHAHYFIVPEQDGKLNAKSCSCRANINAVNKDIDKMCRKEYGLPFMTGKKSKSRGSVEEVKAKSAAALLEDAEDLKAALDKRESELKQREWELREREGRAQVALEDAQEIADARAEKKIERLLDFCKRHPFYSPAKTKAGNEVGKPTGKTIYEQYQASLKRYYPEEQRTDSYSKGYEYE